MPRPMTSQFSSSRTALVVVDPRSIPTKVFTGIPLCSSGRQRARAFLLDHLKIALQPVLDVGGREVARIDQIGFDKGRRLAGSLLDLAHHQQLAGGEAVAALDRVDQKAVGLVLLDIP